VTDPTPDPPVSVPAPPEDGTKHDRGRALLVGGSVETPGAVVLAATAAFRVGAGVVQVATARSVAPALGVAIPETRVVGLPEIDGAPRGCPELADLAARTDAALVGPGTLDPEASGELLAAVAKQLPAAATLVVDAAALDVVADDPGLLPEDPRRVILMPNPSEAARMCRCTADEVAEDPTAALDELCRRFHAVVALRGSETWIGTGDGERHHHPGGPSLLGVSGSGDVLAGAVLGLSARGASPWDAAIGAVHVHAAAAERLAAGGRTVGHLARELLDQLAAALDALSEPDRPRA
jgi:ADP-dependent NAD(P)H-hydrate dehydratase